jgi:hypothetical protein
MTENLSQYWDKAVGKIKQKILGCIFTEKFENFDFESRNNIFTPEIESILWTSKVLKSGKKRQEVKNDLLYNMAPLIIQSCSIISSFNDPLTSDDIQFSLLNKT